MFKKILDKFQYNAPVILTFTLISFLSLLLNRITNGWSNLYIFSVYRTHWFDPMQYIRMITYIFGHANYAHFINNFTIILLVGPMLEEKYGSKSLMEMMIVTALITGIVQVIFFADTAVLGASGIAFMLILLSSFANYQRGKIPITLILVTMIYLSGEIIEGISHPNDNISQMGHIIGGLCGTLFGWVITKSDR